MTTLKAVNAPSAAVNHMPTPNQLEALNRKLVNAKSARDVFGPGDVGEAFRGLSAICHPDRWPNNKLAEETFKLLGQWRRLGDTNSGKAAPPVSVVIASKTNQYVVDGPSIAGDLSDVHKATDTNGKVVAIKVIRSPANNDMGLNEATRLKWMQEEAPTKDAPPMVHIPKLLDTFEIQQGPCKHRANVFEYFNGFTTWTSILKIVRGLDARDAAWMFNRMLGALVVTHQAGLVHGGVVPTNFMIMPDDGDPDPSTIHNGKLVGWTHCVKVGETIKTIIRNYKHFYPG